MTVHAGSSAVRTVGAAALADMLRDGGEIALVDVREELIYSQGHLLWARNVPLSRLELRFAALVPRRSTRIVLCDDDDGLVARAAHVLREAGYTDIAYLDGGVAGWESPARARHRAVAGDDHRGQLCRAHPQHHRRAVADRCRRSEQGACAA